jgi:aryl-alcohol dehydrogenase-like predicted oxidoreductase
VSERLPTRPLGRTGHESSVLAFGAAALWPLDQADADAAVEDALARGVNHFDVAPSYGDAELRLGPSVERHRERMFLACKTRERRAAGARAELARSLERLRTDRLDLYQCHALSSHVELEQVLGPRGAIAAFEEARDAGQIGFLGITGHHCGVLRDALERYAFDSVMFPLNPLQAADPDPALDYRPLLETAEQRGVAAIGIKAIARGPWANGAWREYTTWYEPHTKPAVMEERLRYALSHPIATTVLPSDVRLWPTLFDAAARFEELPVPEREALVEAERGHDPLYVVSMQLARQAYGPARAGSGA